MHTYIHFLHYIDYIHYIHYMHSLMTLHSLHMCYKDLWNDMYIQRIHVRCVRKWTVCSLSHVRSVFATSSPVQKDLLLSACSRDLMKGTANRFFVSIYSCSLLHTKQHTCNQEPSPSPYSTLWCKLRGLGENTVEGICVRFIPLESWHQHPANKETEASTIRGVFSTRPAPSIGATNVTSCSAMSSGKIFCYQFLWALLLPLWPPVVIGQWLQCGIIFMGIPTKSSSCHNDKYTYAKRPNGMSLMHICIIYIYI